MTNTDESDYYLNKKNIRTMALTVLMGYIIILILDYEEIFVEIVKSLKVIVIQMLIEITSIIKKK